VGFEVKLYENFENKLILILKQPYSFAMTNLKTKKIFLASKSPRRQQLLKGLGIDFEIAEKEVDEDFPEHLKAQEIPLYLAEIKADAFKDLLSEDAIVITADTVVWVDDKVLNKPLDEKEAMDMLQTLSGKMHKVYTAVCVQSKNKKLLFYDEASVYFKQLSKSEIEHYVKEFKPLDKAGAYGVQEWIGYIGIEKIEGSFYTIMGFPVKKVYEALMQF
jgi:septum formation protein